VSTAPHPQPVREAAVALPRIGFVGVGWIGRHRMKAITDLGCSKVVGIVEPEAALARAARELALEAAICSFRELLESGIDGIVIATPSALHAEQAIAALESGISVFCQKPLARNGDETRHVTDSARAADRLLRVDLSYRCIQGIREIRELISSGALGHVYSMDLAFHNAYGPDKAWFYDAALSGGGCLIDLGIHLVDLALWMLDFPCVRHISSRLFRNGQPFTPRGSEVEDYAIANLYLDGNVVVQLSCSWKAHAGRDAVIQASFYGTEGGATLYNVNGSFYDFVAEHFQGTRRQTLSTPPDAWGGRATLDWLARLTESNRFDFEAEHLANVADVLDRIYRQ
jgi:predicted dehydrogenase